MTRVANLQAIACMRREGDVDPLLDLRYQNILYNYNVLCLLFRTDKNIDPFTVLSNSVIMIQVLATVF